MYVRQCCSAVGAVAALLSYQLMSAPPASADCTSANGVTVCAQGDVRGSDTGSGAGGTTGPYFPYPCEYDYYCDDWGADLTLDVDVPVGGVGRPGGPANRPDNSLPGGNRGGGGRGGGRGR